MTAEHSSLAGAWEARARRASLGLGLPASFVVETSSTNDDAKRALAEGVPHGALFVAEHQLAGRGRQGRLWHGEPRASLLFSLALRLAVAAQTAGAIPVAAGLALAEAIDEVAGSPIAMVKWPNDVRVRGRKVAGILVDASVRAGAIEGVVVGVGVNVGKMHFTGELEGYASSLANEGVLCERLEVLERFCARFDVLVERAVRHGLRDFAARLAAKHELFGARIRRSDGAEAFADRIDDEGRLVVRRGGIVERWSSGEVHLVGAGTSS